jgi:membrane-bound serine protease (ClpP class)
MTAVGIVLLIAGSLVAASEAHAPTHGISGSVGIVLMAIGLVLALSGLGAGLLVGLAGGLVLVAAGAGALTLAVHRTDAVRSLRPRGGRDAMMGRLGVVRSWNGSGGSVALDGALWDARRCATAEDDEITELHTGDRIVVVSLNGLTLSVRPAEEWELL